MNDDEAETLLERRRTRGMPDDGLWWGSAERLVELLLSLADVGATWAVLVPAGPSDRFDHAASELAQDSNPVGAPTGFQSGRARNHRRGRLP